MSPEKLPKISILIRLRGLFRQYINWRAVRSFGELTVLTRASLSMLVIVPILAAVWPLIRGMINSYNQRFATELGLQESPEGSVCFLLVDANLPGIWAAAFLASLCAITAATLYQAFAPALIKQSTITEYRDSEVRRYKDNPASSVLSEARNIIDGVRIWDDRKEAWVDEFDLAKRLEFIESKEAESFEESNRAFYDEQRERIETEYIALAATRRYAADAETAFLPCVITTALYWAALALLVSILIDQSESVFQEAGWMSSNPEVPSTATMRCEPE